MDFEKVIPFTRLKWIGLMMCSGWGFFIRGFGLL